VDACLHNTQQIQFQVQSLSNRESICDRPTTCRS